MERVRVALLTEIPAPFRIPLFNALAARSDVELRALFLSGRDPKRPYPVYAEEMRFSWRVLPGRDLARSPRWVVWNRGVGRELRRFRPDVVVVGGWNQPAFWRAALHARLRRTPLVTWVESTARDERPGARSLELAKRVLVRGSAAFLVPGRASREYLAELGVESARIVTAPNAVDARRFRNDVDVARSRRAELRRELGLARCTFLFAGRLDAEKGVDVLLDAVRGLDVDLVCAGSGSQDAALRVDAPPNARFAGRLDRDELVRWYAAADALVLPSRSDQWGMVLNEAAESGLPLVATDAVGAAHDLIEDGVNGFRVPTGDAGALGTALARVADDAAFRESAGRRSRELVAAFTPEAWAEALAELVRELNAPTS